jgi:hypothetical protein
VCSQQEKQSQFPKLQSRMYKSMRSSSTATCSTLVIPNATMSATKAQECSAACSSALLDTCVLRNVLSYVGSGHHLYVALVSKQWKHTYTTLENHLLTIYDNDSSKENIICFPQATLFRSAFASPSRVELAHKTGLTFSSIACQCAAGKHADVATLAAAHKLGMVYTAVTLDCASLCNELAAVQYLYSQGCP